MELRHTSRVYISAPLVKGQAVEPSAEQMHYLVNVMRLKDGAIVRMFNEKDGEWAATVVATSKRAIALTPQQQTRKPVSEPDLWLCAAPIKKAHFEYMIEKATELGVSVIQPVLTAHTQIREVNTERCRMIAVEAAEQSDRLSVPEIREPVKLEKLIATWPVARQLVVCAEWGDATPIGKALKASKQTAVLTGPEGGLAEDELKKLREVQGAQFVRLGPRILRADTAAIAALTCWQAQCGDWLASE